MAHTARMGGRGSSSSQTAARTLGRVSSRDIKSALASVAKDIRVDRDGSVWAKLREGGELTLTVTGDAVKVDGIYAGSTGQGVGTRGMDGVVKAARELGAKEVRLVAGQVGTYTWSKYPGMTWSASTGHAMESSYRSWLGKHGHDTGAANGTAASPRALGTSKHGKAFLLSGDAPAWHGRIPL